jgi:hypothetical protein
MSYVSLRPSNRILEFLLSMKRVAVLQNRKESGEREVEEDDKEDDVPYALDKTFWIPIFVCSLTLPGSTQTFHLFEPRYRVSLFTY